MSAKFTLFELLRPTIDLRTDHEIGTKGHVRLGNVYGEVETWDEAVDLAASLQEAPQGGELLLGIYDHSTSSMTVLGTEEPA